MSHSIFTIYGVVIFTAPDATNLGEAVSAYLRSANLRSAYLRGANLRGADLHRANLRDANLRDANLSSANLRGANLRDANLSSANLRGADLHRADLRDANLSGALGLPFDFEVVKAAAPSLRLRVAEHIEQHPELHDQANWGEGTDDPACGTPCCVAGWACHLGGGTRGLTVPSMASILLKVEGKPEVPFDATATREEILAALRAVA